MKLNKIIDQLKRDCIAVAEAPGPVEEKLVAVDALFEPAQQRMVRTVKKAIAREYAAADLGNVKKAMTQEPAATEAPKISDTMTKRDLYAALERGAQLTRRDGETREQAFARYVGDNENGRALYEAYRTAPGEEPLPVAKANDRPMPPLNAAYQELMRKAAAIAERDHLTEAQAFAKVFADPDNRHLAHTCS
jgi:hypothetical protein